MIKTLVLTALLSTSPQVTELLFQLGLGDHIVGTSAFSDYPDAAKRIPVLGPIFLPNLERAIVLKPTLALYDDFNRREWFEEALLRRGVPGYVFHLRSADALVSQSRGLLGDRPSPMLDRAERCVAELPKVKSFRFIAFAWWDPSILFGHDTFLSDLLTKLGGENLAPRGGSAYPQVSREWLLARNPERVFFLVEDPGEAPVPEAFFASLWKTHRTTPLRNASFSRATMTPLGHVDELDVAPAPEACRALR